MNRRNVLAALTGVAGAVGLSAGRGRAEQPKPSPVPGGIPLKLGEAIRIDAQSAPVKVGNQNLHIVSVGTGTFRRDKASRLTAELKAAVVQYAKVEYRVSAAVFDAKGQLLGTAGHAEAVEYVRLGATPTVFREIELDFGTSKAFTRAAFVAVAVSEPDVPKPG